MPIEQVIVIAIVQGITEFLPISSSGHLLLIPVFTDWPSQGLITDVMVHVGSLAAIIAYFWRDIIRLIKGGFDACLWRWNLNSILSVNVILATIPIVIVGFTLKRLDVIDFLRDGGAVLIGWMAIVFGGLMYLSERFSEPLKNIDDFKIASALAIGFAQILALIPGVSRSGVTMTMARFMGFKREEAARFSFLIGIPAIAGAGALVTSDFIASGQEISTSAYIACVLTFFSALAAIAFLMAMLKRVGFLPFVIYRFLLGFGLLYWVYFMQQNIS